VCHHNFSRRRCIEEKARRPIVSPDKWRAGYDAPSIIVDHCCKPRCALLCCGAVYIKLVSVFFGVVNIAP
jgi:hypothetical protein